MVSEAKLKCKFIHGTIPYELTFSGSLYEVFFGLKSAAIKASSHDRLVRRSFNDYINCVLVPAAIHKLIMEDMGQTAEQAFDTMEASKKIGWELNHSDVML